jgi:hypothetical protein
MSSTVSENLQVPAPAAWLGYAGLIPFVTLATGLWLPSSDYQAQLNEALLSYAGIILSFMGAVHWGLAIANGDTTEPRQLAISVLPALVAWFAGFTTPIFNYSLLILGFSGLCIFDVRLSRLGKTPAWYPKLRIPLTVVVVMSLILAQLAIL